MPTPSQCLPHRDSSPDCTLAPASPTPGPAYTSRASTPSGQQGCPPMARDGPSRAELDTDAQRHDVHDLAADAAANAQRDSLASSMGENADDEVDSGPAPPPLALAPIPQLVVVAVPFAVLTEPRVLVPMAEYQLLRQLAAESIHQDTTISQLQAQLAQAQLEAQLVQAQLVQAQAAQAQQAHVAQAPAPAPPVQAPAVNGLPVPSRQRLYMGR